MRPASIVQFERLYLAAAAVALLGQLWGWNTAIAMVKAQPGGTQSGSGLLIGMMVVWYAIVLAIWYFAARRHSVAAKWAAAVYFVLSTVMLALGIFQSGLQFGLVSISSWVSYALLVWSVSYLFKPDADAWFAPATPGKE